MKKLTNISDFQTYKAAQINVERLEILLKDLERIEDILYTHIKHGPIWQLIGDLTDIKIRYMYDYQGWLDVLENKGEVE